MYIFAVMKPNFAPFNMMEDTMLSGFYGIR